MNEQNTAALVNTAPQTSTVEAMLASIDATLKELVQIETYIAKKMLEAQTAPAVQPAQQAAPVAAAVAPQPSVAAAPAPAQQPATPSRPGAGTVGGLVWDYCDQLSKHLQRPPTKEELLTAIKQYSPTLNGQPVNELTAATQYSKWRSAQGLPKLPRGSFGRAPAAAATPTANPVPPAAVPVAAPITAIPQPTAPTIGAPVQPAPQQPAPIPAASVPSVIAPTAVPAPSLPPWLRATAPTT